MTSKGFILALISALFILLFVGFASATDCLRLVSVSVPSTTLHNAGSISFTFNVTNADSSCSTNKTGINLSVSDTSGKTGAWTVAPSNISTLAYNSSQLVTASSTFAAHQNGSITPQVSLTGDSSESESLSVSITINSSNLLNVSNLQTLTAKQNATINVTNAGNVYFSSILLSSSG